MIKAVFVGYTVKKASKVCGCTVDELIHIGDPVTSDANGAKAVGIKAILLDRNGKNENVDAPVAERLLDALVVIQEM